MNASDIAQHCQGVKWDAQRTGFVARCPLHGDKRASLSVDDRDGKTLVHCHAGCDQDALYRHFSDLVKPFELAPEPPEPKEWAYATVGGATVTVVRAETPQGKRVSRKPKGVRGPYLPLDNPQPAPGEWIVVVEGETCVDAVRAAGFAATTNIGGSGGWRGTVWDALDGARAVLWPDNDEPGGKHMDGLRSLLQARGIECRTVQVGDMPHKGDAADLAPGDIRSRVQAAMRQAPDTVAEPPSHGGKREGAGRKKSAEPHPEEWCELLASVLEERGTELRYNIRAERIELKLSNIDWRGFEDFDEGTLHLAMRQAAAGMDGWPQCSNDRWNNILWSYLSDKKCDPVITDWLDRLPAHTGEYRLENLIGDLFEVDDEHVELAKWASVHIPLALVQRTFEPGCKLDEHVVLVGDQGVQKGTFVAGFVPAKWFDEWFTDELQMNANPKTRVEATLGKLVVEWSEMTGLYGAELENAKAFLSRRNDGGVRLAYRRNPGNLPRRFHLIATANDEAGIGVLPDDGKNRRFVVVRLAGEKRYDVEAYMRDNLDRIMAEAMARYRNGERANMPRTLYSMQEGVNRDMSRRDIGMVEAIAILLEEAAHNVNHAVWRNGMTITELADKLDPKRQEGPVRREMQMRLAATLKGNGWKKTRSMVAGKRLVRWIAPEQAAAHTGFGRGANGRVKPFDIDMRGKR